MDKNTDTVNRKGLLLALLPLLASVLIAGGLLYYFQVVKAAPDVVRIASGRTSSDIRGLLEALQEIAAKKEGGLRIELVPSEGPAQDIRLLEEGKVDFAAIPADSVTRPNFSLVANLFPDTYHVIVRADSGIRSIYELEGKRMAVPSYKTAAYRSFWFMIGQYGLNPEMMRPFPLTQKDALLALRKGKVQGMFLMLPPGDRHIRWLAETTDVRILPIDQAEAMSRRRAALHVIRLPKGLYAGSPPLPEQDITTAAASRMLVTRHDVDAEVVRTITSILFENRRDLSIYSHLANLISKPDFEHSTILPVHEGAMNYYTRDEPTFFQQNAEAIGVLFSIAAVLFSSIMWLRRRWLERQKGRADVYNLDLLTIAKKARVAASAEELETLSQGLYELLEQVVHDLDEDRIDGEGFHYFAFTWEAAMNAVEDAERRLGLRGAPSGALLEVRRTLERLLERTA